MFYVYLLHSKRDGSFYTGCTNNLQRRFADHKKGSVFSTRQKNPLMLIHYEAFLNQKDAYNREKWLKTGWGRNHIRKILNNYLENLGR